MCGMEELIHLLEFNGVTRALRTNSKSATHPIFIKLEPGKTTQFQYALAGATVTGKLGWTGPEKIDWPNQIRGSLLPKIPDRPWENVPGYREANADEPQKIEYNFLFTEAGRDHMRQQRPMAMVTNLDGFFEAPCIPPGAYTLRITCSEKDNAQGLAGKMLAVQSQEITIPTGVEEINLGALLIKAGAFR